MPLRSTLTELALTRRTFLRGSLAGGVTLAFGRSVLAGPERSSAGPSIGHDASDRIVVPEGYRWEVVLRWGDAVLDGAPPFDPAAQGREAQERQFGFNCDFIAFVPLERPDRALLAVNHEYTLAENMFPGWAPGKSTPETLATELAAHGMSIVELRRGDDGRWRPAPPGRHNRRITGTTPIRFSGPAAGDALLRTAADPEGLTVRGMLGNCSGGVTPWGTVLTCEENFDSYFEAKLPDRVDARIAAWHRRYGVGAAPEYPGLSDLEPRFDLGREPHEPFRFGWVVEVDPHDPGSTPVKRTALGRFKHEAANTTLSKGQQVVVYMGDDERFEYLWKFVSRDRWDPGMSRSEAGALLDHGTLYVASFAVDGTGLWIPLVQGQGPLTARNGFATQADVLIGARAAADLIGATPLDRPEDVEPSPVTGKVYATLTNNTKRKPDQVDPVNPRPENRHGSILELTEDRNDPGATRFRWDLLLLGGDPARSQDGARYGEGSPSWLSCPDNLLFRSDGRLFVTSDGQPSSVALNDGLYVVETEGPRRGTVRQLLSAVPGAEVTGPRLSPDERTLFVSLQHPGEESPWERPSSRFPDYRDDMPPRPSVIAIWREDGGLIGD